MFSTSTKFNPVTDIVDLRGKVVIVTGGNRGVGYSTIQHLLRGGAKVYMGARNEKKAQEAIESLKEDPSWKDKGGEVVWLKLDLSDPREAKKAAEEFLSKEKRLDVLVNNAALLFDAPFEKTADGPSNTVTVNYISPYIFTETLLPLMSSTALADPKSDVRIINLTSVAHTLPLRGIKFKEVNDLCVEYEGKFMAGFLRYSHSKLLEVLWSKHLQKRLDTSNPPVPIAVIAVHPGFIDTFTHNWPLSFIWSALGRLIAEDAEEGSYTSVFAAASKAVKEARDKYKGAYVVPVGKIAKTSAIGRDAEKAEELYQLTSKFLGGIGL